MKGQPSKTTTVNEPNSMQKPYVADLFKQAQAMFGMLPNSYSGPVAALPQQGQYDAFMRMFNNPAVGQAGQAQAAIGQDWTNRLASGGMAVPKMENYNFAGLDRTLEATAKPMLERYTNQLIPQFKSDTLMQGGGTNSRALELMPAAFNRDLSRELSDSFARTALEDISSIREAQPKYNLMEQQMAMMLPQLAQGSLAGDAMKQQILAAIQGLDQQGINAQLQRLGLNQELAFGPLERYASIIYGSGGGQSTSKTTAGSNPLGGAIGGAMGGAGLSSALLTGGMSNPWTAPIVLGMALLGGLGG